MLFLVFFFQAEDGIRDVAVTGVQTCALPISWRGNSHNQVVLAIQLDCLSHYIRVREEVSLPELVRQHRYRLRVLPVDRVGGQESPPEYWRDSQVGEAVRDQADRVDVLRKLVAGQDHRGVIHGQQAFDNAQDRKSTRLNSSHGYISYAVFCLKKKKKK